MILARLSPPRTVTPVCGGLPKDVGHGDLAEMKLCPTASPWEYAGTGKMWYSMDHRCPVAETLAAWDRQMPVLILYRLHPCSLLPIHPAKNKGIMDDEHNELMLICVCSFLY